MRKLIFICLLMILIAGCGPAVTKKDVLTAQVVYDRNDAVWQAQPYIDEIAYDDLELKSLANLITQGCEDEMSEIEAISEHAQEHASAVLDMCRIYSVYRYIVSGISYISEGNTETIQSPEQTLDLKTGDCEDLTILLMSFLENIGIKTYFVLSEDHAYALVCDADKESLASYIHQMHPYSEINITYYDAFGKSSCIVIDATNGADGYPGYDSGIPGKKTAINPLTEDIEILE
jgi:hypothetical protein